LSEVNVFVRDKVRDASCRIYVAVVKSAAYFTVAM